MFTKKSLLNLIIPLIIEQILMSLMGTADTMMVARVGEAALSAVSLVDSINTLFIKLFMALAAGGAIVCAQYIGAHDYKKAKNASDQLMLSVFSISFIVAIVSVCLKLPILKLVFGNVEIRVMSDASDYFLITALSYPFVALNSASAALYRSVGNSKISMKISIVSNVINIIGNAILIFVFHMGVVGAALATLFSRIFSCVFLLIKQSVPEQAITFNNYFSLRFDFSVIRRIMHIGIPAGIEDASFHLGKILVQSTVATFSTEIMAAQALTATIELFSSTPGLAVGYGLTSVAGQCIGAGRTDEAKTNTYLLTLVSFILTAACSWLSVLVVRPIASLSSLSIYSTDLAYHMILLIAIVKPFLWSFAFTPANTLRAAGDVTFTMVVATLTMWILRVGLSWCLCRYTEIGIVGVWIAMFSDWATRGIIFVFRFLKGKWRNFKVID